MATTIVNLDKMFMRIACVAGDQISLNVVAWQLTLNVGGPTYEDLVINQNTNLKPLYQAIMPATAAYYGLTLQRFDPTFSQPFSIIDRAVGLVAGNLEPRQVSGIISKVGTLPGKPGKGRIYVPFLGDGITSSDGHLDAPGVVVLTSLANALFTVQDVTIAPGVSVRMIPIIANNPLPASNDVSSFLVRTKLATQKRRGDYGRPNSLPW